MDIAQPDVTLHLDVKGVIREATLNGAMADESVEAWFGRPWSDTVGDVAGGDVRRMVDDARTRGLSAFRQVRQRFPSGRELQMEYTLVRLGGQAGMMAIGKSLQAVTELQSRLVAAQQVMERDYWKLREIETRYRLLFDASNEAVILINVGDHRIIEANPAAIRALGIAPAGWDFIAELAPENREAFESMLARVREHGRAPGLAVRLGSDRRPWLVRASLMSAEPGPVFLLQLTPAGVAPTPGDPPSIERLIDRLPDGFAVVDRAGVVMHANPAFIDLVQAGAEASVVGQRLHRWLSRPGADASVLLDNARKYGQVRSFQTILQGELGTEVEAEISTAGDRAGAATSFGILVRDVRPRLTTGPNGVDAVVRSYAEQIGKTSLPTLVKETVAVIERHYIEAALERTEGNRTAAAELLGLSRQSLYVKLARYEFAGSGELEDEPA